MPKLIPEKYDEGLAAFQDNLSLRTATANYDADDDDEEFASVLLGYLDGAIGVIQRLGHHAKDAHELDLRSRR